MRPIDEIDVQHNDESAREALALVDALAAAFHISRAKVVEHAVAIATADYPEDEITDDGRGALQ